MPAKKKNSAAVALNRLRWKGVTKDDRQAIASSLGKASAASLTPDQRKARAKKAAACRKKKAQK